MLKTLDEVLPKYINADAAVGAFNLALFPDTKVLIEAAEEMNAPVILQISPVVAEFMGYDYWGMIAGEMARRSTAEVVLHLDHANMVEPIWKALDAGFSSVMFDGSQLPFEDNVRITNEVVKRAERYGASVEAEIGSVAYLGRDSHKDQLTDPKEAAAFAEASGCGASELKKLICPLRDSISSGERSWTVPYCPSKPGVRDTCPHRRRRMPSSTQGPAARRMSSSGAWRRI